MDFRLVPQDTIDVISLDWFQSPGTGLIDETEDLKTAVIVALCTDALADVSDVLPDPNSSDRRGWWGDYHADTIWGGWPVGCKLWLLTRAKILGPGSKEGPTLARVQTYISQAIQPFVTARLCSRFVVGVKRTNIQRIDASVTIFRGPKSAISLQFQALWGDLFEGSSQL